MTDVYGCIGLDSIVVELADTLKLDLSYVEDSTGNSLGNLVTLVSGGIPPYTYNWSNDINLDSSSQVIFENGIYSVIVIDQSGCEVSDSLIIGSVSSFEGFNVNEKIIEIFDIHGEIVLRNIMDRNQKIQTINISQLGSGIYFVKVGSKIEKLIVSKH